ncbi:hypothetical protein [Roseateles sp.]|uniref:hypothetical protein n=1 Tax=Roseateles sp. TaxID=1971397 RepID=UPI002F4086F9
MSDAIDAAALAMYGTPRLAERNRDMAERAISAAEAIIRADERAKVGEDIAKAIEDAHIDWALDCLCGTRCAAIARQHAANRPESHGDATEAPREGSANHQGHNGAQEAVG